MRLRIEAVQLPVNPDDDLLGQFLGFLVLTGKAICEGEEPAAMPADEVGPRGVGIQFTGSERPDGRDVLRSAGLIRFGSFRRTGGNRAPAKGAEFGQFET